MKNLSNKTKTIIVVSIGIISIVLIVVYFFMNNHGVDYSKYKIDKTKTIVYTIDSKVDKDIYKKEKPYLNINSSLAKDINTEIDELVSDLYDKEYSSISYNYEINGNVLSLLVKMIDYKGEYGPEPYFVSYNYNLKDNYLLSNDELLGLFNYDYNDVEYSIEKGFNKYYSDLLKKGYYNDDECDYECFLDFHGVEEYLDDVVLYIDRGKLYAIKPFSFYTIIGDEDYFKEKHFNFLIEKKES